jgi:hypothetical protein
MGSDKEVGKDVLAGMDWRPALRTTYGLAMSTIGALETPPSSGAINPPRLAGNLQCFTSGMLPPDTRLSQKFIHFVRGREARSQFCVYHFTNYQGSQLVGFI